MPPRTTEETGPRRESRSVQVRKYAVSKREKSRDGGREIGWRKAKWRMQQSMPHSALRAPITGKRNCQVRIKRQDVRTNVDLAQYTAFVIAKEILNSAVRMQTCRTAWPGSRTFGISCLCWASLRRTACTDRSVISIVSHTKQSPPLTFLIGSVLGAVAA